MSAGDLIKSAVLRDTEGGTRSHCARPERERPRGRQLRRPRLIDGPGGRARACGQMVLSAGKRRRRPQLPGRLRRFALLSGSVARRRGMRADALTA